MLPAFLAPIEHKTLGMSGCVIHTSRLPIQTRDVHAFAHGVIREELSDPVVDGVDIGARSLVRRVPAAEQYRSL